jgi:hypothetical protein
VNNVADIWIFAWPEAVYPAGVAMESPELRIEPPIAIERNHQDIAGTSVAARTAFFTGEFHADSAKAVRQRFVGGVDGHVILRLRPEKEWHGAGGPL